jgi:hypothetical protein
MAEYIIDVAMSAFDITTNRRTGHADDVYLYWKVQLRQTGYGIDGKVHPATDVDTARLHIPGIPLLAPAGMVPDLSTINESFFENPTNPFKDPLKVRLIAKSNQAILIYYVAESIINERADPAARSRAFNNTVNDIDKAITVGMAVGSVTPAAPWVAAVGGAIKEGLALAKDINNYLDPPDAPQVDCSGPLAAEYEAMSVSTLVDLLGEGTEITHEIPKRSYQQAPEACSAHGSLCTATLKFTIKPAPEFGPEDHDSANWKVSPITGVDLSQWAGTWGETADAFTNTIECAIQYFPRSSQIILPRLFVEVREKSGPRSYSVNLSQNVFSDPPSFVDTVPMGDGRMLRRNADSIQLHDRITLYLYSARDRNNQFREYRIRYRRRNDAGTLEVDRMLVRAFRVT